MILPGNPTLPPGCTAREISGDTRLKLYTIEFKVLVSAQGRDDESALRAAEEELALPSNARIHGSMIIDAELFDL